MKKPKPAIGQMWSWSHEGEVYETVLLTRNDLVGNFYGVLLFTANNHYDIGCEYLVGSSNKIEVNDKWFCVT